MTPVRPAVSAGCLMAVIVTIGLAMILPAPGQAAGDITVIPDRHAGPTYGAPSLPPPPQVTGFLQELRSDRDTQSIRVRVTAPKTAVEEQPSQEPVAGEDRDNQAPHNALTQDELRQVRDVLSISRATAGQVGMVTLAVKGIGILLAGGAWILLLVILRRTFNYWFDRDIWEDPYLSTAVVLMLLYCTHAIVKAVVS